MFYSATPLICAILMTVSLIAEETPLAPLPLSSSAQIAALTSEPSALIGGLVSPLSGESFFRQTDLILRGAEPIVLSRIYLAPDMFSDFPTQNDQQAEYNKKHLCEYLSTEYLGWQTHPHLRIEFNPATQKLRVSTPLGITLDFARSKSGQYTFDSPHYGISNAVGELVSGAYDLRNTRISQTSTGDRITVRAPDGTSRIYSKTRITNPLHVFFLQKEVLPSGKVIKYHYDKQYHLCRIESLDPQERYVYASFNITGSPTDKQCRFTTQAGLSVDYTYQKKEVRWKIKGSSPQRGKFQEEVTGFYPPVLAAASSPANRSESIQYSDHFLLTAHEAFAPYQITYTPVGHQDRRERVHRILFPVGSGDTFIPVYEFMYQPPVPGKKKGMTTVRNIDGTSVTYHFSKDLLTSSVQHFDQTGELKKEERMTWDEKNWLHAIEIFNGQHQLLCKKTYEYDAFGNPVLEKFTGNLKGQGKEESYTLRRTFSDDGKNLLLTEASEDGKYTSFTYLPNTHLLIAKLTQENNKIIHREFHRYDDNHNLIQSIIDDGLGIEFNDLSQVTQRTLKTYSLRQTTPFLHMPEWITESYLEDGVEKLLKKTHLVYDEHGRIAREEKFDAEGTLVYTLHKTYNERGDCLTETNPLGQQAVYTYTSKGALATALNFSHRLSSSYTYDKKGRQIQQTERGDDGQVHTTSFEYDAHDRLIRKTDAFGNFTDYTYYPCTQKISKTHFPSIASIDGEAVSVTTSATYDALGRLITETTADGKKTIYQYNAYGSPTEILYADGSREAFVYAKNGLLLEHTHPDGHITKYRRDLFGRVLSEVCISNEGVRLSKATYLYNTFHLLSKTDKKNGLTQYLYNKAGQKIEEIASGGSTQWRYNPLGYLSAQITFNQDSSFSTEYHRDLEGKILTEQKKDHLGTLLSRTEYTYDVDGHLASMTCSVNERRTVETFRYDPFARLIAHQNTDGHLITTTYHEDFFNTLGQRVLQTKTCDTLGTTTIKTYDALNRLVQEEIVSADGDTLYRSHRVYDPQGKLCYQQNQSYENGLVKSIQSLF